MDFKRLRWLFILPITFFVGFFEWIRHYPLHYYLESKFPGWQENFFAVIFMMIIIAVFSHRLINYIKRLNQELLKEREKLRLIIDHSADAIVVLGPDKTFKAVNPAAISLLGWPVDELVDRYLCEDVLKCHDGENSVCDLACLMDTTISAGITSSDVEVNICNRDGQSIPVSLSCSKIPSNQGQEDAMVLVIRDMREKRRLEEELEAIARITSGTLGQGSQVDILQGLVNKIVQVAHVDFAIYNTLEKNQGVPVTSSDNLDENIQRSINQIEDIVVTTGKMEVLTGEGMVLVSYPVHCCGGRLTGVITYGRFGEASFSISAMNTLSRLAKHVMMVVENFLLYQQVQDGATLDERYRLAREIHDGLSQGLGYLNLRCKKIENHLVDGKVDEVLGEIREVRKVVKDLYQEARTSIFDLKLNPGSGDSFVTFLQNYLAKFENQTSISTKLVLPEEPIKLTQKIELHMIRIIQEALANIRKHSHATLVELIVDKNLAGLKVQIWDNGVGLAGVNSSQNHFGLAIMEERAAIIGAEMRVAQGENGGTVVTVELSVGKGGEGYGINQSNVS